MEGGAPHAADRAQVESGSEDGPLGRHVGEAAQQESPCSLLLLDDDLESLFTGPTGIAEVRPPSRTAERTIPGYTCTSPCQGGIATSRFIAVPPAYLSNDQYYIIGTHTYSRGGHEWTDEIEVIWQAKAPRLRAVAAILEAVITELAGRINETQEQEIRDAFDEAGGS